MFEQQDIFNYLVDLQHESSPIIRRHGHQRQSNAQYIGNAFWSEDHLRLPYHYQQYEANRLNQMQFFFFGMEPSIFGSATA
jgi:hypothetical protein